MKLATLICLLGMTTGFLSSSCGTVSAQVNISSKITDLIWSPDGQKIAVIADNLSILRTDTLDVISVIETPLKDMAWGPNSQKIVTGGWDGKVNLWNIHNGQWLTALTYGLEDSVGIDKTIVSIDWSKDGSRIAAVIGFDEGLGLYIWDASTHILTGSHTTDSFDVAFSPDGIQIAVGRVSGIGIYDGTTGENIIRIPAVDMITSTASDSVLSLKWASNNRTLIALGPTDDPFKQDISVWDVSTQEQQASFQLVNSSIVGYISLQPTYITADSGQFTALLSDGSLTTWDLTTGKVLEQVKVLDVPGLAAFSPYSGRLVHVVSAKNEATASTLEIIVPQPSINRLNEVAGLCSLDVSTTSRGASLLQSESISVLKTADLPDFITQVESLPEGAIPAACAADLIAVAEAILAQP